MIFAANHSSHLDTLAIVMALPRPWRRRLAPAMSQDFFGPLFVPGSGTLPRLKSGAQFLLASWLFNAYPLPQRLAGARRAMRYAGELADAGYCPLIFPEGRRVPDGEVGSFLPGVGLMAKRLALPVVPVRLEGLGSILPPDAWWPRGGRACVLFGRPLDLSAASDYAAAAAEVERAVRELSPAYWNHKL